MERVGSVLPPVSNRRQGKYAWDDIVATVTAHPGEWFEIDDDASSGMLGFIKKRKASALQDPKWVFEASTRDNNKATRRSRLFIRAVRASTKKGK